VKEQKGFWRAFLDWFVLFSGISTARNLSRTRKAPIVGRGLFLFRKPGKLNSRAAAKNSARNR
jgi:hypothetical protein